ncbi:MAG: hypothetical protein BWY06_03325 [Candidatus Latescibacteria bacterium ADurb.Bin168]|nr:MAG: hypothetical protein BWY06_03325 [Candidatus Latescibacteria bacterium ADurb.Bin168]
MAHLVLRSNVQLEDRVTRAQNLHFPEDIVKHCTCTFPRRQERIEHLQIGEQIAPGTEVHCDAELLPSDPPCLIPQNVDVSCMQSIPVQQHPVEMLEEGWHPQDGLLHITGSTRKAQETISRPLGRCDVGKRANSLLRQLHLEDAHVVSGDRCLVRYASVVLDSVRPVPRLSFLRLIKRDLADLLYHARQ